MQLAVQTELLLVQADSQRDAKGIAVFEGYRAFNTHDILGKTDVIVVCLHDGF